ncbi:hypothetical protein EPI10_001424 [Gossypium australe]|uniref:Uncharacterized protein n=1 Tax=Gossypium australe TaxID=47621 RepID=A0A5B6VAY4_9ROSI|nr:hypothetical protein EPI10_001424 [Gossypium australe]
MRQQYLNPFNDEDLKKSDLDCRKAKIVKATEGSGTVEDRHHTTQLVLYMKWLSSRYDPNVGGILALQMAYFATRLWHTGVPSDRETRSVDS